MPNQQVYIILGAHRSGTSLMATICYYTGVYFGGQLKEKSFDNAAGFYEHKKVVALNDKILACLGQTWSDTIALPADWTKWPAMQPLAVEISTFLQKTFANKQHFAIKDPRLSLTLPLWQLAFQELEIQPTYFVLIRHPEEVAQSLQKRDGFPIAKGRNLWLKYMVAAEFYTRNNNRYFIHQQELITASASIVNILATIFQESPTKIQTIFQQYIRQEFIHHQAKEPISDELLRQVYQSIQEMPNKEKEAQASIVLDKISSSSAYQARIVAQPLQAKIVLDYGQGYTSLSPIFQSVRLGKVLISFTVAAFRDGAPLVGIKLHPISSFGTVRLLSYHFQDEEKRNISIKRVINKFLAGRGVDFLYDQEHFIEYELGKPKGKQLKGTIELEYIRLNQIAYADIPTTATIPNRTDQYAAPKKEMGRLAFWLTFIGAAFRSPSRLFKHLNKRNFRKLKRALANESPAQILANFKKLLFPTANHQPSVPSLQSPLNSQERTSNFQPLTPHTQYPKPSLLYIFPDLPDHNQSSGGKRSFKLLKLLVKWFEVTVFTLGEKPTVYQLALEEIGVAVTKHRSFKAIKKEIPTFHFIVFSTYRMYWESKKVGDYYPAAKTIIDTVDVHWLREERSLGIWEGLTEERVATNKQKEIAAYQAVDQIWTVTAADRSEILSLLPAAEVAIISNIHDVEVTTYSENDMAQLLFMGNYHHYPNISAVETLVYDILPKVQEVIPRAKVIIAGANAPTAVLELATRKGVIVKGYVPEAELPTLYKDAFLSVSPLLAGAGIKGKIGEAIAHRVPVVTNLIGNEGINLVHGKEGLIGSNEELPNIIIQALQGGYDLEKITKEAQRKVQSLVGREAVEKNVLEALLPVVDICIVTYNRLDLLEKCINSILEETHYPNYRILVYSNGCEDGTQAYLKQLQATHTKVQIFLRDSNEGFVKPNNVLMHHQPTNDVVLLNNDVEVTKGWLFGLYKTAYATATTGIAGGKILYPDGTLQEFGAIIYKDGSGLNIGKGQAPDASAYAKKREAAYVSGCLMYIKRSTIEQIGVFDEAFHPCYFEDSDFCYRAKEKGLKTYVTPESIIYHYEGATAGTSTSNGFKRFQELNKQKFLKRHGRSLKN